MSEAFDHLIPYASRAFGLSAEEFLHAFRPATPEDLPAVLALRRAATAEMWWDDEAFLQWRYFRRTNDDGSVPYWVFLKDGVALGACGLERVTLVVDSMPVDAVRSLDIMVRPDIDGRGLGAFMNLMLFRRFPIMLVTGSNDRSHHLLSRMFHHAVDLVFWKTLLGSHHVIDERVYGGLMSRVLATGGDLLLALARWGRNIAPPRGVHIRELSRFDDRVTDLCRLCEHPGRVIVRRNADYLNWRFLDNPRCRYRAYGAFAGDYLVGYVITRLNLARPNPRREGEIVDWLALGDPTDGKYPLSALIAAGLRDLAKAGAGLVTCAAYGADVARAVEDNGFQFREGQAIPFFVKAESAGVHHRLTSESGWFLTRGDLDVE